MSRISERYLQEAEALAFQSMDKIREMFNTPRTDPSAEFRYSVARLGLGQIGSYVRARGADANMRHVEVAELKLAKSIGGGSTVKAKALPESTQQKRNTKTAMRRKAVR